MLHGSFMSKPETQTSFVPKVTNLQWVQKVFNQHWYHTGERESKTVFSVRIKRQCQSLPGNDFWRPVSLQDCLEQGCFRAKEAWGIFRFWARRQKALVLNHSSLWVMWARIIWLRNQKGHTNWLNSEFNPSIDFFFYCTENKIKVIVFKSYWTSSN